MRVWIECFSRKRAASAAVEPFGGHVQLVAQSFRGLLQLREIVAVGLDQLAHALDRIGLIARADVAVGHLRCRQRLALPRLGIGGVEPLQRMGDAGQSSARSRSSCLGTSIWRNRGSEKISFSSAKKPVLVGSGEVAQVEVVGLGQPQQDLRGHRALVTLDQVDVARRDRQPLGDLGLRQPQLLPDPPEAWADEQFLPGFGGHVSDLQAASRTDLLSYS